MGLILIIAVVVLTGPLAVLYGADSRPTGRTRQAWWPAAPRSRR